MATTRVTRSERKARTRDELLVAARKVFLRRGFHGATLEEIADEAGYTKGAVYSNFDSKEGLFLALYERRVDRAVAEMERRLADGGCSFHRRGRCAHTVVNCAHVLGRVTPARWSNRYAVRA